jgi:hypothetical protein
MPRPLEPMPEMEHMAYRPYGISACFFCLRWRRPLEIATMPRLDNEEGQRIQQKQGGHHMPPKPDDGPPLDDTDRNSDKVIKPSTRKP